MLYLARPTTKAVNASNGIKVTWTKSSGAKNYTIYRSEYVNGKWSGWKTMITAKSDKTSWTDKSVKNGVQYKYAVKAVNGKSLSAYKASASVTVPAVQENVVTDGVFVTPTGSRYHFDKDCGGKNSKPTTLEDATKLGYTPCQKCAQ